MTSEADKTPKGREKKPSFVELPNGLFTEAGIWFNTSTKDLQAFAGPVLDRVPLEKLLAEAGSWLRSPGTLSLWLVLLGLLTRSVGAALLLGTAGLFGWLVLSPGLVLRPLVKAARILEYPLLVGGAYVVGLSRAAAMDHFAAVAAGLVWFIVVRWGLLERLVSPVLAPIRRRLYRLPAPDQVLRALLVRYALALRVNIGDLEAMEKRMLEIGNRHRNK